MVFDADQAIPLASLRPAKTIDLDLMHPELLVEGERGGEVSWTIEEGQLAGKAMGERGRSLRWTGGFNPFATYDVVVDRFEGTGAAGLVFADSASGDRLVARLQFRDGRPVSISWEVRDSTGEKLVSDEWELSGSIPAEALTLRVQMAAVGVNLLLESSGRSELIGYSDFSQHLDLRETRRARNYDFGVLAELDAGAKVALGEVSSALTPGSGQADIRAITDEVGDPLLDGGRLWFSITIRGRAMPHPLQGVFSLDPSVFDIRFEGIIVFDMGDGLLRNELASHLFLDSVSGEWRGWTTGFSALGGAGRAEEKTILAVSSVRDPRRGFSVMKACSVGIEGAHEDPHGVFDAEVGKWRLLLSERHEKYRAGMWESDEWNRGFTRLAGPVEMDSTGTMIQSFGGTRYVLFGSADRRIYIRTYPDLGPAGQLDLRLPPWDERHGTRVWPNVIPLPEGFPAPYIALMMDRVNFPGMPRPNWTYGALYLYHGFGR